jgi:hypothetical protein
MASAQGKLVGLQEDDFESKDSKGVSMEVPVYKPAQM